jgi:hypothetical protein
MDVMDNQECQFIWGIRDEISQLKVALKRGADTYRIGR